MMMVSVDFPNIKDVYTWNAKRSLTHLEKFQRVYIQETVKPSTCPLMRLRNLPKLAFGAINPFGDDVSALATTTSEAPLRRAVSVT